MNIASFLSGGIDNIVASVGGVVDSLFTSDEEREKAKAEIMRVAMQEKQSAERYAAEFEATVTKRWERDSEHLITRLVRPMIVIFVYTLFGALILADGNVGGFSVKEAYVPLLETIIVTITVAYFGSRGIEKVSSSVWSKKNV